jgi:Flp pilus assembly protein TadG
VFLALRILTALFMMNYEASGTADGPGEAPMLRREGGQSLVEFALAAVVFFTFLFTIMDFAVMFFVQQTMQHAVRSGARLASISPGSNCAATMIAGIQTQSMGFYDKNANASRTPVVSAQTLGHVSGTSGTVISDGTCGTPEQPITVSLDYSWPLLTPFLRPFFANGRYTFTAKATVVNEPPR